MIRSGNFVGIGWIVRGSANLTPTQEQPPVLCSCARVRFALPITMGSHQQSGRILCEAIGWLRLAQCRSVSRRLVDLYHALEFNTGCDGVIGCKCNVSVWTGLRAGAYLVSCIRLRKDAECGTKQCFRLSYFQPSMSIPILQFDGLASPLPSSAFRARVLGPSVSRCALLRTARACVARHASFRARPRLCFQGLPS